MFDLQNHPWMDMFDEDLEKSIEDSKLEEEEEKKGNDDEDDDTEYINMLKKSKDPDLKLSLVDHSKVESRLGDFSLGKKSPRRASPRNLKYSPRHNGGPPKPKKSKSGKGKKKGTKSKAAKS